MASFVQNGLFLIPISSNEVSFTGTDSSQASLVAFHPIIQNTISPQPIANLCPLNLYAIRVLQNNSSSVQLLAPGSSNSSFTLTSGFVSDPSQVVTFQPLNQGSNIIAFQEFAGALIISGQKNSNQYIVEPRSDFTLVGYGQELPVLLSDCSVCGCPSGEMCESTGQCQLEPDVCSPNAQCGDLNGTCSGPCLSTNVFSECRFVSGGYTCVQSDRTTPFSVAIYVVLFTFAVILLLYLLSLILYHRNKPLIYRYPVQTQPYVTQYYVPVMNP